MRIDHTNHPRRGSVKRLRLTVMAALVLGASTTWAGPFEDAVSAHKRGDFATALRLFRSLAAQGEAEAQFNMGWMSEKGQGVAQDYAEAAKWYRLSAIQGFA